MPSKHLKLATIWVVLFAYCIGISSTAALAAPTTTQTTNPTNNGQALEIAPPLLYLNANPGQTLNTQVLIRDISSGELVTTEQINDFVASGEDGTPKVILNNNDNNNPYSMRTWVVGLPSLLLQPRQILTLPVTINVPSNASPGGHYAVIRVTATPPSLKNTGVSLSASIGVLVLLTVSGKITEGLQIQQFSVNRSGKTGSLFQSGPLGFVEVLKNTGNVHVQPVGQVSIVDMFGNKFASVNVNLPPGNVLPDSLRKFAEPLNSAVIGNKMLFGRYTATLKIEYGSSKKILTEKLTFWVIPYTLIAIIIVALVGGFFVLRFFIRRYNQHILDRAKQPPKPTTSKSKK
jgi:hypothetical protein